MKPKIPFIALTGLLVLVALFLAGSAVPAAQAQTTDLIISEYGEGSSFNKYIEIYNGTGAAVDLSGYVVWRVSNGGSWPEATINLAGNLAPGEVAVVHNPDADTIIADAGDLQISNGGISHNGDDALGLVKAGVLIDSVGTDGADPGSGWEVAGTPNATKDHVLVRKSTVCSPTTDWDASRGTNASDSEWIVLNNEDWSDLGMHTDTCNVDLAPTVTGTNPANGADYINVDTNIEVAFSEPVTTTGDWFEISCDSTVVPAVASGGPSSYTLDPVNDLPSSTTCTVKIIASQVADQDDPINNMLEDYIFSFTTGSVCGEPAMFIHEVQGPGDTSPVLGQIVTVEAVVVGDFVGYDQLRGFFVQEEKADFDNQKATSEGVFVYRPNADVEAGQRVRVTGEVDEYFNFTEITDVEQIQICGEAGSKEYGTVNLRLPEKFDGQLEQYEGMYVQVPSGMTVAQNYFLGRYGQLTLTNQNRMYQPTNEALPGSVKAETLADRNARSILFLDDGTTGQNPDPVPYLGAPPPMVLRGGDTVQNLVGVLDYGLINNNYDSDYRLHPTEEPVFTNKNVRPQSPDNVGGTLKVATMNVLNYFTTLDDGDNEDPKCGPDGYKQRCRGADANRPGEFVIQETKIVQALIGIDADIVGLIELENNQAAHPSGDGIDPVLEHLVSALNTAIGTPTYDFIDAGVIGTDVIKVALIYKTSTVSPGDVDSFAILDQSVDPTFLDEYNRPVLAQTFEELATGEKVTVAVNHLKSKGSDCDVLGDPDTGDGQGNCNLTRQAAAAAEVAWLAGDPTYSGDPDYLIIGDLNSYAMEDPITTITDAGYIDLANKFEGAKAYSYTFDGLIGTLDYIIASSSLKNQVRRATIWHINTDEPSVINYDQNYNPPDYWSPDPFRSSDHDPVIVGLQLQ